MATNYNNFYISKKRGKFYLKESQPTAGYEEVIYGEGKKTYHKYFKYVQGVPSYFGTKEVEYDGKTLKFLELSLTDGDDVNKISVPLKNKGGYTDEARKIISALNSADLKEKLSFSLKLKKYTKKNGSEGEDLAIYGNYVDIEGENGKPASTGFIKFNEIPPPTFKKVAGDIVWDFTGQTEFFYNKIQEIEERFISLNSDNNAPPKTDEKTKYKKAEEDFEDDLPF